MRYSGLFLAVLTSVSAWAQQSASDAAFKPDDFELSIQPKLMAASKPEVWDDYANRLRYRSNFSMWLASVDGTVGKGDFTTDVDVDFDQLFDKMTIGFGLDFEVGKGPLSVIVFGQYQHFEDDAATRRGFDADLDADFGLVDIALAYVVWQTPGLEGRFTLEVLGGFRWTYLQFGVEINEGPLAGRDQDREKNWFDPYVGLRARYDFNRHWNISLLGTGGGFGVGSDCAWSAYAQIEYRFTDRISVIAGYRAISYDYEDDGFIFDATMHGPVIGIGFRM